MGCSSWRRLVAGAIAAMLVGAACGDGDARAAAPRVRATERGTEVAPDIEHIEITGEHTAAITANDDVIAVVKGAARTARGVRPVLLVARDAKSAVRSVDVPTSAPLLSPVAWAAGSEIVFVGRQCPDWTDPAKPPVIDFEVSNKVACGSDQYVGLAWDSRSGAWRSLPRGGRAPASDVELDSAVGRRAILGTDSGWLLFDTEVGVVETLPWPPVDSEGPSVCLSADGTVFATLGWDGDKQARADKPSAADPATAKGDDGSALAVYRWERKAWHNVPVKGTPPPGGLAVNGCVAGAALVFGQKSATYPAFLTMSRTGPARLERLDLDGLPDQSRTEALLAFRPDDQHATLGAWDVNAPTGPGQGRPFPWVWRDGKWQSDVGMWDPESAAGNCDLRIVQQLPPEPRWAVHADFC